MERRNANAPKRKVFGTNFWKSSASNVAVFKQAVKKSDQNIGKCFDKAESQGFEYPENLPENELPELILLSDFAKFRLFNLETNEEREFPLEELPNQTADLEFVCSDFHLKPRAV